MSESLPTNFLLQAPVAIAYLDRNLRYTAHSAKWCSDYNLPFTDLIGKHHYELFPEIQTDWKDKHQRVLNEGITEANHAQLFLRQDGSKQWLKWEVGPIHNASGEIDGIVMMSEDITNLMVEKSTLDRERQFLLDATNKAKIGSWEINYDTNELYWSSVTKQIHEVSEDFIPDISKGIDFYKPGINQQRVTDLFATSSATGETIETELQIITAEGNERWVQVVMKADLEDGVCVRQFGTFEDITDKVESDLNYKLALRKFQEVFQASGVGMLVMDPIDLSIIEANSSICNLLNYKSSYIKNSFLQDFVSKQEFPKLFDSVTDLLNKKVDRLSININLKKSTGRFVICSLIGTLIEDENGDPIDLVLQIMDISAIKKKEEELQAFTKYVEQQNERLLNFAHIVSHNLRSHSSNFEVLLHLYNQENNEEDKQNIVKLLGSSSTQLSETISHLNEAVAVSTQKLELSTIYLKENIFKVMENISTDIKINHVDVEVDIDQDFTVDASPAYLESIFLNLLTNSIKYRKKNVPTKIHIKAFKHNNHVRIIFQDNGTGIDMKQNGHKVFGMYKTFHGNDDARGIGLYMTKNQVEAMGGSIKVHSQKNIGTTFKITL